MATSTIGGLIFRKYFNQMLKMQLKASKIQFDEYTEGYYIIKEMFNMVVNITEFTSNSKWVKGE